MWSQGYDPFSSMVLSTAVAAIPVVVLLGAIGILEVRAHIAALLGLLAAFAVAVLAGESAPRISAWELSDITLSREKAAGLCPVAQGG